MNESNNGVDGSAEITLSDVAGFLAKASKWMLMGALLGGLLVAAYIAVVPRKYTATASVRMAQVPRPSTGGSYVAEVVESPAFLAARMKAASTLPAEVIGACASPGSGAPAEPLSRSVSFLPAPQKDVLSLAVQASSPEVAKACANAIFELIRAQQAIESKPLLDRLNGNVQGLQGRLAESRAAVARFEKAGMGPFAYLAERDEISYLYRKLDQAQAALDVQADTRLVGAVEAPSQSAFPRRPLLLGAVGVLAGLLGGLIVAGLRRPS